MIGILRSLDSHESSAMICDYNVCNNFDTEKSFAKLAQMQWAFSLLKENMQAL